MAGWPQSNPIIGLLPCVTLSLLPSFVKVTSVVVSPGPTCFPLLSKFTLHILALLLDWLLPCNVSYRPVISHTSLYLHQTVRFWLCSWMS